MASIVARTALTESVAERATEDVGFVLTGADATSPRDWLSGQRSKTWGSWTTTNGSRKPRRPGAQGRTS